jgi:hypothetical protein
MEPITPSTSSTDYSPLTEHLAKDGSPLTPEFRYKPLGPNSIRLIILQPNRRESNADVHCRLVHQTFASKPIYEALSYTWGEEAPTEIIYVNGARLRVRANLYLDLIYFQQDQPRTIWADAICIDQSNNQEWSVQVGLMDVIYQRAEAVRIWLGCVSQFTSLPQVQEETLNRLSNYSGNDVVDIVSLPYWNRAWIIQEIGLSTSESLHVGNASID